MTALTIPCGVEVAEACRPEDCGLGDWPHPAHDGGRVLAPTLCRLEYWDGGAWVLGHHGTNLLYPARYIDRLAERGKIGRVTLLESATLVQKHDPEVGPLDPVLSRLRVCVDACPYCDQRHSLPHDGMCLL